MKITASTERRRCEAARWQEGAEISVEGAIAGEGAAQGAIAGEEAAQEANDAQQGQEQKPEEAGAQEAAQTERRR